MSAPPQASFLQAFRAAPWLPTLGAGVVAGTVAVMMAITYAAVIFSGELEVYQSAGIGLALFSAALLCAVNALGSSYPGTIAVPQDAPAILLGLMAVSIAGGLSAAGNGADVLVNIVAAIALSTIITGAVLFGLGLFGLGGIVLYVPFPVIGGFRAGVGWLLLVGSFSVMTGRRLSFDALPYLMQDDVWAHWLPGIGFTMVMTALVRWRHRFLLLPLMLALAVALFYAVLLASGWSIAQARAEGWLLGPFPEAGVWQPVHLGGFAKLDWPLLLGRLPELGSMVLITVTALLLVASNIELGVQRDMDLNRELKSAGLANMLAGLGGGLPGYHHMGLSILNARLNAPSRLVGLIASGLCIAMLLVGTGILDYLPRPVMGGLLMYLGAAIMIEQVYDEWFKVPKSDHFVIVLILVVTGLLGYLHGILAGLVAGLVLFVVNYSRVSLIKVELSGATFSSNVERTETARNFLKKNGERIYILRLQGYLFFGTANRLLRRVRQRAAMAGLPPLRYLVLDFRLVNGLDSSALISFLKIGQMAAREQFVVIATNLSAELRTRLEKGRFLGELTSQVQDFPDLGDGLEWCEDNMLVVENMFEISQQVVPLQQQLKRAFSNAAHAKGVMKYLEKRTVEHGDYLMRQGEPSDELYFVESGRVSVQLDLPDGGTLHIRTMGPGTLVGETAFMLGGDRTSGAVAETRSVVYRLTTRSLRKMVREHPVLASTMYAFMARMLAERLVSSSRILKAAME